MKYRPIILIAALFTPLLISITSCDLINPDEKIPSFLCIDSISVNSAGHGNNVEDIVDAWVFDNEQLVGVYELPAIVPILSSGETNIRIRPGVKLNGQAGSRWRYEFLEDFVGNIDLFEDSTVCINPVLPYKQSVLTPWVEDFETATQQTLTTTSFSEGSVQIITGPEAFGTKSALLSLSSGLTSFECKSNQDFSLPDAGASVVLEFSYKCNHPFRVSVISTNQGGSIQSPVIELYETDGWKHVYLSLTDLASAFFSATHTPVFGYIRSGDFDGEINVYLDNIKLTHF